MTQDERRIYLIRALLSEEAQYRDMEISTDVQQQKQLLRALFNVRMPRPVSGQFLEIQDSLYPAELILLFQLFEYFRSAVLKQYFLFLPYKYTLLKLEIPNWNLKISKQNKS